MWFEAKIATKLSIVELEIGWKPISIHILNIFIYFVHFFNEDLATKKIFF